MRWSLSCVAFARRFTAGNLDLLLVGLGLYVMEERDRAPGILLDLDHQEQNREDDCRYKKSDDGADDRAVNRKRLDGVEFEPEKSAIRIARDASGHRAHHDRQHPEDLGRSDDETA